MFSCLLGLGLGLGFRVCLAQLNGESWGALEEYYRKMHTSTQAFRVLGLRHLGFWITFWGVGGEV